jgi:glutamine amidotransferase
MCRIFYALGQSNLSIYLYYFLAQSIHFQKNTPNRNSYADETQHLDGYGLAGFRDKSGKWILYRSALPPFEDPNRTFIIDKMAKNRLVIGHLRNADHSESAPREYDNTHPFYYKNAVFMHNGRIHNYMVNADVFTKIYAAISPAYYTSIRGNTDSELLFYMLLTEIRKQEELYPSSRSRRDILISAINECFTRLKSITQYTANIIYGEKEYSVITRFSSESGLDAPSLYVNFTDSVYGLFLSSEPLENEYALVSTNTYYVVNHQTSEYTIHRLL